LDLASQASIAGFAWPKMASTCLLDLTVYEAATAARCVATEQIWTSRELRYNLCEALQYWLVDCRWTLSEIWILMDYLAFAVCWTRYPRASCLVDWTWYPQASCSLGTWITKRPVFLFSCLFQTAAWRHSPERWQLQNYSVQIGLPNSGRSTFHCDAVSYASVGWQRSSPWRHQRLHYIYYTAVETYHATLNARRRRDGQQLHDVTPLLAQAVLFHDLD